MPIVTLRPNAASAAAFTATPAGTAVVDILAGTAVDDTRYITRTDGKRAGSATISFGTTTVASNQRVRGVRVRFRMFAPDNRSLATYAIGFQKAVGLSVWNTAAKIEGKTAAREISGSYFPVNGEQQVWSQSDIDSLQALITDLGTKANRRVRTYLLYADVDIATQGTATVSAPTGTITDSPRPTLTWSFVEADGTDQSYYEARIYTSATVGASGFTPDDTDSFPPVFASGEVASSVRTVRSDVSLENGDYYAYVRAGIDIALNPFWSPWATSAFTLTVPDLPATPTVTATQSLNDGYVSAEAAYGAIGTADSSRTFQFQRSLDGTAWSSIGDEQSAGTAAGTATFLDYFAPRGGTAYYRARQLAVRGDDTLISTWGSATVSVVNDNRWWFKPVNTLGNTVGGVKVTGGYQASFAEQATVYQPIGRDENVVVSAGVTGQQGSFTITTVGDSEWTAVLDAVSESGEVYVESPDGESWRVWFTDRSWSTDGLSSNPVRTVNVGWVVV
jgi:hypothetical protein